MKKSLRILKKKLMVRLLSVLTQKSICEAFNVDFFFFVSCIVSNCQFEDSWWKFLDVTHIDKNSAAFNFKSHIFHEKKCEDRFSLIICTTLHFSHFL